MNTKNFEPTHIFVQLGDPMNPSTQSNVWVAREELETFCQRMNDLGIETRWNDVEPNFIGTIVTPETMGKKGEWVLLCDPELGDLNEMGAIVGAVKSGSAQHKMLKETCPQLLIDETIWDKETILNEVVKLFN